MGYRFLKPNSTIFDEVLGIADIDGDGLGDMLLASTSTTSGSAFNVGDVYLVTSSHLAALDIADGTADKSIRLSNIGSTHGGYRFLGSAGGNYLGSSLADLGDIDGDGLTDFAIAASGWSSFTGRVYVVTSSDLAALDLASGGGSAQGLINVDMIGTTDAGGNRLGFVLQGATGDGAGTSMALTTDLNADGLPELLISATQLTSSTPEAYLVPLGSLDAIDAADGTANGTVMLGSTSGTGFFRFQGATNFGSQVASLGTTAATSQLIVGVTSGTTGLTNAGGTHVIKSDQLSVLDAADGAADGTITLTAWQASGANGTSTFFLRGERAQENAGRHVSAAGDFNGDGVEDFMVYAHGSNGTTTGPKPGTVYLVSGAHLTALDAHDGTSDGNIELANVDNVVTAGGGAGYRFTGVHLDDRAGEYAMIAIGDYDGDGLDDLLIGAKLADSSGTNTSGAAYLIPSADLGSLDAADGTNDGLIFLGNVGAAGGTVFFGVVTNENAGYSISTVGDMNGDGKKELLISTARTDAGLSGAYVITSSSIAAMDAADGASNGRISLAHFAVCYVRGTRILTARGELPVEEIAEGDLVMTLDAGPQPVRWAGASVRPGTGRTAPVLIPAGALGNRRALCVSPQHRMLVPDGGAGVFLPALKLLGRDGIARGDCASVAYHHLMLGHHHLILAEGAPSESFFPGPEAWRMLEARDRAAIRARFPAIDPDLARLPPLAPGRPVVPGYGPLARRQATTPPRHAPARLQAALHA